MRRHGAPALANGILTAAALVWLASCGFLATETEDIEFQNAYVSILDSTGNVEFRSDTSGGASLSAKANAIDDTLSTAADSLNLVRRADTLLVNIVTRALRQGYEKTDESRARTCLFSNFGIASKSTKSFAKTIIDQHVGATATSSISLSSDDLVEILRCNDGIVGSSSL